MGPDPRSIAPSGGAYPIASCDRSRRAAQSRGRTREPDNSRSTAGRCANPSDAGSGAAGVRPSRRFSRTCAHAACWPRRRKGGMRVRSHQIRRHPVGHRSSLLRQRNAVYENLSIQPLVNPQPSFDLSGSANRRAPLSRCGLGRSAPHWQGDHACRSDQQSDANQQNAVCASHEITALPNDGAE